MLKFIAGWIKPLKKWNETESKNIFEEGLKLLIFNDLIKLGIFTIVAVVFGILSNFAADSDQMILISWWFGWFPLIIIIVPYILMGLIIFPLKELFKKFKKK